ncbi:MAG TPA: rhodanese-like domain-containing protein [Bacteroidia bacterium]|nr:rhodanese-like domain-containing protein [Bacteroidia bacterium]
MKKLKFLLFLFLFSYSTALISCQQGNQNSGAFTTVTTEEFKKSLDQNEGVLIDVRTPEEFAEGHLQGAMNIDFNAPNFKDEIGKLDKSKTYEVYCRSGKRSGMASGVMQSEGFKKVINLDGGILGWQEKGFPVVK